jgi:hypothetical protein
MRPEMIFEWRSYDLLPGKVPAYIELLRTLGLSIVTRHLPMVGYWFTESGTLNRLHHLWAYRDFEDRTKRRVGLGAERVWTEQFLPQAMALVLHQHNSIMRLEQAGQPFDDLCEAAFRGPVPADSLAPEWLCQFTYSATPLPADPLTVASWRVVSGHRVGGFASFTRGAQLPAETDALLEHELIRAFPFSPLR